MADTIIITQPQQSIIVTQPTLATVESANCVAITATDSGQILHAENIGAETIQPGMACAVYFAGGVRLASSAPGFQAVGLAVQVIAPGNAGDVRLAGLLMLSDWAAVTGTSTLQPGANYCLQTTPGQLGNTPTLTPGQTLQWIGHAVSTTTLKIAVDPPVLL